ncbi:hypothetical protein [Maricaulis sp. CAU 1757]
MSTESIKKSPSLQHLAAHVGQSAEVIAKNIASVDPRFLPKTFGARNYVSFILSGQSVENALNQAMLEKRDDLRKAATEIIPLADQYRNESRIKWFRPWKSELYYHATPTLVIPVKPLGLASVDGRCRLIWPQHWKTKTLSPFQFRFWATVIHKAVIAVDPDVDGFHWLEMSATDSQRTTRELRVRDESTAELLSDQVMAEVAQNLEQAIEILRSMPKPKWTPKRPPDDQPGLFD